MRKLKFILSIITVIIIAFTSLSQLNSQSNLNMKKGFYLGPMSHYFLNVLQIDSHNRWYQDLSYNMMQSYCAHLDSFPKEWSTQRDGGFFEPVDHYDDEIRQVIQNWKDIANDNSLIFEREKILRPCYGQRFTYQAEKPGRWRNIFPAYGYDSLEYITGHDTTEYWMNETVTSRRCVVGRDTLGFIVKDLYENCSQTNNITRIDDSINSSGWERLYSDVKQKRYNMRWFIKPRMRIDSLYAKANPDDTVVVVYVKNFNGDIFDTTIIKCRNFLRIIGTEFFYDGRYLERYFNSNLPIYDTANFLSVRADSLAFGRVQGDTIVSQSKVDYQVKWHGKVDVWLDYVRVDDSWAHYLFTSTLQQEILYDYTPWEFHLKIKEEVEAFIGTNNGLGYFWVDEVQYPNLECIGEVNKLVKQYSNNTMSLIFITDPRAFMGWPAFRAVNSSTIVDEANWDICIDKAIDCGALSDIMVTQWFPFYYTLRYPDVLSDISDTLHIHGKVLKADNYHQYTYIPDVGIQPSISWFIRQQKYFYKKAREKGLIYGVINQINSDEKNINGTGSNEWGIREPTNEEISMLMHTSMAYGAKIMLEFSYTSAQQTDTFKNAYNWGLTSTDRDSFTHKRDFNYYGQRKWDFVASLNRKLKQIGDFMYPMGNTSEHLVHNYTYTVNDVTYPCDDCGSANHDYIQDIISYAPYNDISEMCTGSNMQVGHNDCSEERYWELGFYSPNPSSSKPPDNSKYLYAVNKRTYPVNDTNDYGDIRVLKIMFKSASLTDFNNWVIKEAATDSVITYFNKLSTGFVYAGEFQPGEGKLLKIVPVMTEGGTLVCDEYINTNFTCNGMVYGNGHNITINQGRTISFSEDGGIFMEGGCFVSNINSDNADAVTLQSTGGANHWKGITLSGCDSVGIYNTTTSNAESNDTPKTYSYSIINSYKVNFRKCNFITENNRGIIEAVYSTSSSDVPAILKIRESNFFMENCGYTAINVLSNASASTPLIAEWCTFHSSGNDTSCAVMLTGVAGGAVKNCYFYDFGQTMIFISSTVDLYGNLILGGNNSKGIQCLTGSSISLGPNSGMYLGGYNYFRNYGTASSNICTDDSFFDIDCGNNEFDIDETEYSKHLTGTMIDNGSAYVMAYKNCFHEDSITNIEAVHDVMSDGNMINFLFEPYFCDLTQLQDFVVFEAYGFPDTVYYKSGGEGGGFNPNKTINAEENTYKSLKDTVDINLRKRNYQTVETNSKLILTQYPDSLESIGMVQKLYMASLNLDSTRIGITKTFLENLISNNTQNPSLIKRAFYFIQKCKVKLGQFQSALEGFQYIMTQNPYTYEGLVASWDYAATYLLMGTGGSIQGDNEQKLEDLTTPTDTLLSRMSKRDINTNRNSNNSANEKIIKKFYEKIKNTTKDDRSKQEEKVKTLEKKLESSKSTPEKNEAARELAVMKQIKEAVKIKKPNTVMNHIQIMNDDIKKVFGVGKQSSKESTNSLIPQTYQLYQNYPNPFNPTTKIAFDLPKDAKIKLVIYDILGREMKTLVNNEFRSAGKYITEFNGSNMASGIYFARILVNEGKDFMAVKKMVLLK